ncbi:hypothetical protein SH661x_003053 [Planctomicrobium sp. SH661]|uniref:hypothetical protein n=1 Tax=Planctomicrobium sp. SH661 TaxID=3448124 RepID=UPI003F5CA3A6
MNNSDMDVGLGGGVALQSPHRFIPPFIRNLTMVREARFAWDENRPLPIELTRRHWDCDDPDESEPRERRHRLRREPRRSRRTPQPKERPE